MKISEIAEIAGVSVATVSRAINNKGKVSPEVKKRIMDIVAQYDYVPNATGRSLRTSKTGVLLLTIPDLSNPFYNRMIKGAQFQAAEHDYNIILAPLQSPADFLDKDADNSASSKRCMSQEAEEKYISLLSMRQVDGMISLGSSLPKEELQALNQNYPVVFCCECPDSIPVTCVEIDNRAAALDAVNHLYQLGHKKIAMISFDFNCTSVHQREEGYSMAILSNHLTSCDNYIVRANYSYEGGYECCRKLFSLPTPPTAIFCYNDRQAVGAIQYLSEHGLIAGKDVDIIGFDDTELAQNYMPSISSVSQPAFDMGITAVELLIERIKDQNRTPKRVTMPHQLVLRNTTHRLP